ncbi:MAG: glycosyltransferase family 4 protein [Alphaproteobacteria bacterium]|nr:glycosyltransferase family 4 protein [Alphaproteobacteria bacterium]
MKILHVYKTYFPDTMGGVEQVISTLSKGLLKDGIVSEVFCLTPNKDTETIVVDGIRVHRCPSDCTIASTPLSLPAFKKFRDLSKQFDIIHYHFPYPFADMLHFAARTNPPTVVTYHSDIVKQKLFYPIYKPLMYRFLKSVNCIVATSPAYMETSPILKQFKNKTSIIPIGIDKKDYPAATPDGISSLQKRFGDRFFAFVGVLRYYKGLHTLIEAVRDTSIQIVIAGTGPIEHDLKKQAAGLTNVHFLGAISDQQKADLLTACYGFVFPSHLRSEAFGISLLEAAMYKKPLISCEIGTGTSYINHNQTTGFVIEPNQPEGLKQALMDLLANPKRAKEMGENAHTRYLDLFSSDKMISAYKKLYHRIQHPSE